MIYDVDEYLDQCKYEKEMKYLRKIILSNPDLEKNQNGESHVIHTEVKIYS